MQISEPKRPRNPRHPLWSVETLKEDLSRKDTTLTNICKRYASDPEKWRAFYNDVARWRRSDQELDHLIEENTKATDSKNRDSIGGGRPRKDADPEFANWRYDFCEALLSTKSRVKAADVTPYKYEDLHKMLNENYKEFDKAFADMVHLAEMKLVAYAEEVMWTSLDKAESPKDQAWIAERILKARDRSRWGDKIQVDVGGTVKFELNRTKLLGELAADQQRFFDKHNQKQIASGEVLEAEVISE